MLHEEKEDQQTSPDTMEASSEGSSYKDLYIHLNADFQNYKRRIDKERTEWMLTAQIQVLEKLLCIFDELDRAIQLSEKQENPIDATWLEGFKLIQKNWHKTISGLGVKEISTEGLFNPMVHEALMREQADGKTPGEIVNVFSKGYQLRDKVIQHAKVSVSQ